MLMNKSFLPALLEVYFFFFLLLSQFYFYSSGTPQPAHWIGVIMAASIVYFFNDKLYIRGDIFFPLILFFLYSTIVNLAWSIWYSNVIFLRDSIFIMYNLTIFATLLIWMSKSLDRSKIILSSCFISLMSLFLIWLLEFGRYNFYPRYNGFFNDPNQMAFWVLCVSAICVLLSKSQAIRISVLFGTVFLVALTLSRSGLLGLFPFVLGSLLVIFSQYSVLKKMAIGVAFFVSIFTLYRFGYVGFVSLLFERFKTTDFFSHAEIRGYSRIMEDPFYLLFGAGKGMDFRFATELEIHSTWAGLLFYYGFFGIGLILLTLFMIITRLSIAEKLIFLAPLTFGFGTYGFRSPIFWVFLAVFAHVSCSRGTYEVGLLEEEYEPSTFTMGRR